MTTPPTDHGMSALPTRIESSGHWVELFAAAFAAGDFTSVAALRRLVHPDYHAVQSQAPDAHGPDGFLDLFKRVYALVPDLRGEVLYTNVFDDGVYIEVRLSGTLGGKPVTWDACDRFRFAGGLVIGRTTYLDPLPLFSAVARRPRAWTRWWRSGLGAPTRSTHSRFNTHYPE